MDLLSYLEKFREKPESAKRRAAIIITLLIMAAIVGTWLTISSVSKNKATSQKNSAPSPFSTLKDIFKF